MPTINLKVSNDMNKQRKKLGKTWLQIIQDGLCKPPTNIDVAQLERDLTGIAKHLIDIRTLIRKDTSYDQPDNTSG